MFGRALIFQVNASAFEWIWLSVKGALAGMARAPANWLVSQKCGNVGILLAISVPIEVL